MEQMDTIDQQIITYLVEDGRMPNSRLAKMIGLSESATLERVRRLENAGVIEGYSARVNPLKVDRGLEVYITFTMDTQRTIEDVRRFEAMLIEMEEVLSCSHLLGRIDFIAHVAVKDVDALHKLLNEKLIPLGYIGRIESLAVLKTLKRYRSPVFLDC